MLPGEVIVNQALVVAIPPKTRRRSYPDGTPYISLSVAATEGLAQQAGCSIREVEAAALEQDVVPERYARNMRSLSPADQLTLLNTRVSIVGLGGLGGTVVEILARLGVGTLVLVDGDRFEDSNLNRQVLSRRMLLGAYKVDAARRRVNAVNAGVDARCHRLFLDGDNAAEIIDGSNVVVDCLDNIPSRFILESAAKSAGIPMVTAAVAGTSGQIGVIFPEDVGLSQIYGPRDSRRSKGAETVLGTLPHAVILLAALECTEVVKVLLGRGQVLRRKLLLFDAMDLMFETLDLSGPP